MAFQRGYGNVPSTCSALRIFPMLVCIPLCESSSCAPLVNHAVSGPFPGILPRVCIASDGRGQDPDRTQTHNLPSLLGRGIWPVATRAAGCRGAVAIMLM